MTCLEARELFSARVDEALAPDEGVALDGHLAGCAECRRELARFESTVSLLRAVPPAQAPAGFAARVLARTAAPPPPANRSWRARLFAWLGQPVPWGRPMEAVALVLVAVTAVYLYQRTPELRQAAQPEPAYRPPSAAARSDEPVPRVETAPAPRAKADPVPQAKTAPAPEAKTAPEVRSRIARDAESPPGAPRKERAFEGEKKAATSDAANQAEVAREGRAPESAVSPPPVLPAPPPARTAPAAPDPVASAPATSGSAAAVPPASGPAASAPPAPSTSPAPAPPAAARPAPGLAAPPPAASAPSASMDRAPTGQRALGTPPVGREEAARPAQEAMKAPGAGGLAAAAPDVSGRLAVTDRVAAELALRELLARLHVTEHARRREGDALVLDLTVPASAYAELVEGLARFGRWEADRLPSGNPRSLRLRLRLTD